jgi:hypothetical protein
MATVAISVSATATIASPLDSLSKISSQNHNALTSPSHKESKWLVFPQQQEMHSQSLKDEKLSALLRMKHEKISLVSFFGDHAEALGIDEQAVFSKRKEFGSNGGSVTHHRYEQTVSDIPVFGGDFHLTVGSHDGGKSLSVLHVELSSSSQLTLYIKFDCWCSDERSRLAVESHRYRKSRCGQGAASECEGGRGQGAAG